MQGCGALPCQIHLRALQADRATCLIHAVDPDCHTGSSICLGSSLRSLNGSLLLPLLALLLAGHTLVYLNCLQSRAKGKPEPAMLDNL